MAAARPVPRSVTTFAIVGALAATVAACGGGPPELRGTVVVAHAVSRDVVLFEAPSMKRLARIPLPGSAGQVLAEPGARRAWTVHPLDDSVSIVDIDQRHVLRTVRVCGGPTQLAFVRAANRAWVVCSDGYLVGIDTRTLERVGRRQAVGFGPYAITPGPKGHLWTANRSSNDISEIDARTGSLVDHYPAAPAAYGLAFTRDGRYAFVTSKEWHRTVVIATDDKEILGSIDTGKDPALVVAGEDRVYVASRGEGFIAVVNTRTFQVVDRFRMIGKHPETVVLSADERVLLVTTQAGLVVLDAQTGARIRQIRTGQGPASVTVVG